MWQVDYLYGLPVKGCPEISISTDLHLFPISQEIMQHSIRLFLSSTFRDMQKERDYLVNLVFPALRTIAEERGIPFSWCDLRFGVSSFEEEYIVRLCLKNIKDCAPSFVGLLGNNYGSVPSSLNKQQIKRLSIFEGVPSMIRSNLGYTEMEMRYFITQYASEDTFDFYFFVGDLGNIACDHKERKWRDLLYHPVHFFFNLLMKSPEIKVLSWKKYVYNKTKQNEPIIWNYDESIAIKDDIIYQTIKKAFEQKFPLTEFPNEELIWNEQQSYLQEILCNITKNFDPTPDYTSVSWEAKDIMNLYSLNASGKSFYAANQIKHALSEGGDCYYYFVGASRNIDTPVTIWKNILYQICKKNNIDYHKYINVDNREILRNAITECLDKLKGRKVLIVIDGFGEDVTCSIEHRNTVISDFPDPSNNIKYIITSNIIIAQTSRVLSIVHECSEKRIKNYIKNYALNYYGFTNSNFVKASGLRPADLREAKHIADELVIEQIGEFGVDTQFAYNNIYDHIQERISNQISSNNALFGNKDVGFYEGLKRALLFIAITKEGIIESDICKICNIDAEQWTILYGYLSPFFKTKGCIKLNKQLSERICHTYEIDVARRIFIENLEKTNGSHYVTEILFQASQLEDKKILCNLLATSCNLNTIYDIDKDLLIEYLVMIEESNLLENYIHLLDNSFNSVVSKSVHVGYKLIHIFYDVFPRYAIVERYIDLVDSLISTNYIENEFLFDYYALKANVYSSSGRWDKVKGILELAKVLIDKVKDKEIYRKHKIQFLLIETKLYNNDFQPKDEKIKALSIYREILDLYQNNLEKDVLLDVLNEFIMLKKSGDGIKELINQFSITFLDRRIIKENSHNYGKYQIKHIVHTLLLNKIDAESQEADSLFDNLFYSLENSIRNYPFSKDNCDNMFLVFELMLGRIKKLSNKNLYTHYKENVHRLTSWISEYTKIIGIVYSKNSLNYAYAMFELSRLYGELAYVNPINKEAYLSECIKCNTLAEESFNRIFQGSNIIIAKLYHNRANYFNTTLEFQNALKNINTAININDCLGMKEDDSMFNSEIRRISILIDQILYSENLNNISKDIELCNQYITGLLEKIKNISTLSEQTIRERLEIVIKLKEQLNLFVNDEHERFLRVAQINFEEIKRCFSQLKDDHKYVTYKFGSDLVPTVKRCRDLNNYIQKHDILQDFYILCPDYLGFEELIEKMHSIIMK